MDYITFVIDMITSFPSVFVIIFFVLSGFFIARSLEKKSYSPIFFYGDRIIRIYIPYLGSILISFIAIYYAFKINPELLSVVTDRPYNLEIIKAYSDMNISSFINSIFFLQGESGLYFANNNPYWSLYYEAIFYIFIPFILLYFRKFSYLAIAIFLYFVSFFIDSGSINILSFFVNYLLYFAAGVAFYQISSSKSSRIYILKTVRKLTNLLIFSSLLLLLVSIPLGILGLTKISYLVGMTGTLILILWILYGRRTKIFKIFNKIIINNFSHFLGKISFSIYLIHVPIFVFMYSVLNLYTGEIVYYNRIYWIPVLLMIPVSYVFYLVFEKNSLILLRRYKNYFFNKDKAKN